MTAATIVNVVGDVYEKNCVRCTGKLREAKHTRVLGLGDTTSQQLFRLRLCDKCLALFERDFLSWIALATELDVGVPVPRSRGAIHPGGGADNHAARIRAVQQQATEKTRAAPWTPRPEARESAQLSGFPLAKVMYAAGYPEETYPDFRGDEYRCHKRGDIYTIVNTQDRTVVTVMNKLSYLAYREENS